MDSTRTDMAPANAGKAEKRTPRSIRFYDTEWERIEAFADEAWCLRPRSSSGSPRSPRSRAVPGRRRGSVSGDGLAPLIEMTFRATYIMATKMRDEMLDAGRKEELDELVAAARGLQDEILGGGAD